MGINQRHIIKRIQILSRVLSLNERHAWEKRRKNGIHQQAFEILFLNLLVNCKWPHWWRSVSWEQYGCRVYLPVFSCHVKLWAATAGLNDKGPAGLEGEGDRLSDGCPIHHGGPCWWAKESTCGGEGEVVSEESALFDYSRSIIQTRAAQNLSVWWQPAEWLLPLWAKCNVLTRGKGL